MAGDDEIDANLVPMLEEDARRVGEAQRLAGAFELAASEFAAQWMGDTVRDAVRTEHAVTQALPPSRLSELKAGVAKVQAAALGTTIAALRELPWVWRGPRDEPRAHGSFGPRSPMFVFESGPRRGVNRLQCPSAVEAAMKVAIGEVGWLLRKAGYKAGEWFEPIQDQTSGYRYRRSFDVTGPFLDALKEAALADTHVAEHRAKLTTLRRELKEARANSAWENA